MTDAANLKDIQAEFNMRQDPDKYKQTIADKLTKIQEESKNQKRNAFARLFNQYGQHIDMEHNAINFSKRNEDLVRINSANVANMSSSRIGAKHNTVLSRRQVEINDWYYQDKLETLFFLQMFFMTMLTMTIVFYFQKTGFVTTAFAGFLTFILLSIVALAGLYRYIYTSQFRDPRWWYKRRFGKPAYKEEKKCGCEEDPFVEPKTKCPAKVTGNAADCMSGMSGATPLGQIIQARDGNTGLTALAGVLAKDRQVLNGTPDDILDRAQNQLEAETIAYMQGKKPPAEKREPASCDAGSAAEAQKWEGMPGSTNVALNQRILPYL